MDWFRHGTDVLENTCFLDHARLRFRRETWAVDLFRRVSTREDSTIQAWQEMLTIRDPGHLSEVSVAPFMLEHGTWPVPPSVLVGQPRRVGTLAIGPTFLIEGHHRLAYLLSMTAEAHPMLQASHATWVAEESG